MKFSVLLPTKDRLDYFRHAAYSVLQQDYQDWELVVSDNASTADYEQYVSSLGDSRIVYSRSTEPLVVTDNWNRALSLSTGDYVVMLGDDDGLMKGYFGMIARILDAHPSADLVYTGGLLYAYPGVMPMHPEGYLQACSYASFLRGLDAPRVVPHDVAVQAVCSAFRFRATYPFNMQFAVLSRQFIERLAPDGTLYRSPYPDYYAMNVAMTRAREIVACPLPLVTVGITPQSFGYYFFNARESEGVDMLGTGEVIESSVATMPGSKHLRSWLAAVTEVQRSCPDLPCSVDYRRYRFLQAGFVYRQVYLARGLPEFPLREFWAAFPRRERWVYRPAFAASAAMLRVAPRGLRRRLVSGIKAVGRRRMKDAAWEEAPHIGGGYLSLRDVVETVEPDLALVRAGTG